MWGCAVTKLNGITYITYYVSLKSEAAPGRYSGKHDLNFISMFELWRFRVVHHVEVGVGQYVCHYENAIYFIEYKFCIFQSRRGFNYQALQSDWVVAVVWPYANIFPLSILAFVSVPARSTLSVYKFHFARVRPAPETRDGSTAHIFKNGVKRSSTWILSGSHTW
jgi:hypothetical protein